MGNAGIAGLGRTGVRTGWHGILHSSNRWSRDLDGLPPVGLGWRPYSPLAVTQFWQTTSHVAFNCMSASGEDERLLRVGHARPQNPSPMTFFIHIHASPVTRHADHSALERPSLLKSTRMPHCARVCCVKIGPANPSHAAPIERATARSHRNHSPHHAAFISRKGGRTWQNWTTCFTSES